MTKEPGYAEAMVELEEILEELEGDDLDIDVLADRVRRASELIASCRTRIARAQADVESIVTDLADFDDDEGDEETEGGEAD
jgi:exodeoxyribonuclease VII small subunit